jgi:tetratricopeptide (TPR) repeat protein
MHHRDVGTSPKRSAAKRAVLPSHVHFAQLYQRQGRHAEARDHNRQALAYNQRALNLLDELGDRPGAAASWDGLGHSHHQLGYHAQAITCYQRAIDLYRHLGHRYHEANVLTHLGDTHRAADHTDEAHHCWQQALRILDELRHSDAAEVRAKLHHLIDAPAR